MTCVAAVSEIVRGSRPAWLVAPDHGKLALSRCYGGKGGQIGGQSPATGNP